MWPFKSKLAKEAAIGSLLYHVEQERRRRTDQGSGKEFLDRFNQAKVIVDAEEELEAAMDVAFTSVTEGPLSDTSNRPSVVAEESPHPPFGNCKTCGGYFAPDKLKRAWIFSIPQEEGFPTLTEESYCDRCTPSAKYTLRIVGAEGSVDDSRAFTIEEGWLQELDEEGNDLYTYTPDQHDLLYFDCGCDIQKRGQTKCPECEKPKKR